MSGLLLCYNPEQGLPEHDPTEEPGQLTQARPTWPKERRHGFADYYRHRTLRQYPI